MPSRSQQTSPRRWLLGFLAALIAALAAIQLGTTASASAAGVAENRVRAHSQESTAPVGASDDITAGQQLEDNPAPAKIVVATGVAAKAVTWADKAELDLALKVGDDSVGVLGNVSRSGSVVTIDDIAMFGMDGPLVGQVGSAAIRQAGATLLRDAAPSGVNQVVFRGVRSVSSSGKPGHVVDLTATLSDDGAVTWRVSR